MSATQTCSVNGDTGCEKKQQAEDCFSRITKMAIRKDQTSDMPTKKALLEKIEQHQKDQKAARRAAASTAVYDIDTNGSLSKSASCLKLIDTSSPASLRQVEAALGLRANSLVPGDFANEKNGYRSAVFYDQREQKYVVVFRGTNKNNLIDWKNNINNQLPSATSETAPSYFAAKRLGMLLKRSNPPVEYTGHSKGGGEVYEALSNSPSSTAIVFNSAGPSPRIEQNNKDHIATKVQAYQVGGEMLNMMQDEKDPAKTIENMKWLRGQVNSGLLGTSKAIKISERDNEEILLKDELKKRTAYTINTTDDEKAAQKKLDDIKKTFEDERKAFIKQLDDQIAENEANLKAGRPVKPFSQALGERRVVGGDVNRTDLGLFAMMDHTMDNMNAALNKQIETDQKEIESAIRHYEPDFDKKLNECSKR